jgi:hypothetical protein
MEDKIKEIGELLTFKSTIKFIIIATILTIIAKLIFAALEQYFEKIATNLKRKLDAENLNKQRAKFEKQSAVLLEYQKHQEAKPPVPPELYHKMNRPCDGIQPNVDCVNPDSKYMPKE